MEWIVLADNPTRAMEQYKAGDIVRCKDCRHSVTDGIQVMCNHFAMGVLGRRARSGHRDACSRRGRWPLRVG